MNAYYFKWKEELQTIKQSSTLSVYYYTITQPSLEQSYFFSEI